MSGSDQAGENVDPEGTPSHPLYENLPLGPGEIRLFYIDNGTGPELICHLKKSNVQRQLGVIGWLASFWNQYEALSYYWGSPDDVTHSILCNDEHFSMRSNLYDALMVLRQLRPEVPIWTDAICIDQGNRKEKRAQIRIMGKIYSNARQVWAFLGDAPSGMADLIAYLPELYRVCKRTLSSELDTGSYLPRNRRNIASVWHKAPSLPPSDSQLWKTLMALMDNEYFNRLWILQEVALAKSVDFLCGCHRIPWTQMKLLFDSGQRIEAFQEHIGPRFGFNNCAFLAQELVQPMGFGWVGWLLLRYIKQVIKIVEEYAHRNSITLTDLGLYETVVNLGKHLRSYDLGVLIQYSRMQHCSDPRDRILGITGMLQALLNKEEYPWIDMESTKRIYLETFYYLAFDNMSFQMLQMAPSEPQNGLSLPSWCPDFHRKPSSMTLEAGFSGRVFPVWQASRMKQRITRGVDKEKLRLIGVRVSNVCHVSKPWMSLNLPNGMQRTNELQEKISHDTQLLKHSWDLIRRQPNAADEGQLDLVTEHFWRTTLLERTNPIGFEDLSLDDFLRLSAFLDRATSNTSSYAQEVENVCAERKQANSSKQPSEMLILGMIDIEMRDKVFFLTENGHFGLAYPGACKGDTVSVFDGAKVPHLLRSRPAESSTWTFVGETYVHDLMHGEAEEVVDGQFPGAETFVLV